MSSLGLALMVGGAALFVSGLVFLLPTQRKQASRRESVKESIDKIDSCLREMRRHRGDIS
jgi:hypothetical protein